MATLRSGLALRLVLGSPSGSGLSDIKPQVGRTPGMSDAVYVVKGLRPCYDVGRLKARAYTIMYMVMSCTVRVRIRVMWPCPVVRLGSVLISDLAL